MDIKHIHDNDIHEKYILNQLDEKEKQAYETFLKSSPQAQKELHETRRIIGGIKDAGSSAMHREIEEQVSALRNPKTDWSIIYKAAAVLFVLVLLPAIFYYQDRFTGPPEISEQSLPAEYQHEAQNEQPQEKIPPKNEAVSEQLNPAVEDVVAEAPAVKTKQSTQTKNAPLTSAELNSEKEENNLQQVLGESLDNDLQRAASGTGKAGRITDVQSVQSKDQIENERIQLDSKIAAALQKKRPSYSTSTKSDRPAAARSQAPSSIISMDYIPKIRSFIFSNDDDSLKLNMKRTSMRSAFPDILKMSYTQDSTSLMQVDIYVSDRLHSFERSDINVTWENSTLITVHFSDKATYRIKLEQGQKTAIRLK